LLRSFTATQSARKPFSLSDWATDMNLVPAGPKLELDAYVGDYEPYATSHEVLDGDKDFQEEVRNAGRARTWRR
jgi:hypothetical protein